MYELNTSKHNVSCEKKTLSSSRVKGFSQVPTKSWNVPRVHYLTIWNRKLIFNYLLIQRLFIQTSLHVIRITGGHFLVGFTVHISNQSDFGKAELLYTDYSTTSTISSYIPIPLFYNVARYVRISIPYPLRRLHLREVWVLGGNTHTYTRYFLVTY